MAVELKTKGGNIKLTAPSGGGSVDLSNYYTKLQTDNRIDEKIAAMPEPNIKHYHIANMFEPTEEDKAMFDSWCVELPTDWYISCGQGGLVEVSKIDERYIRLSAFDIEYEGVISFVWDSREKKLNKGQGKIFATTQYVINEVGIILESYMKDYEVEEAISLAITDADYTTEEQVIALIKAHGGGALPASEEGEF
jgi:hypothetical protein